MTQAGLDREPTAQRYKSSKSLDALSREEPSRYGRPIATFRLDD